MSAKTPIDFGLTASFREQADALKLIDREALEGWFAYYSRTRDKSAAGYSAFKRGRLSAIVTLDTLAELETLVGTERTVAFIKAALAKARAKTAEEEPGP